MKHLNPPYIVIHINLQTKHILNCRNDTCTLTHPYRMLKIIIASQHHHKTQSPLRSQTDVDQKRQHYNCTALHGDLSKRQGYQFKVVAVEMRRTRQITAGTTDFTTGGRNSERHEQSWRPSCSDALNYTTTTATTNLMNTRLADNEPVHRK